MIAAVSMVKDEADVVAETVGRMAAQVDYVLVADNGSTDGTRDILQSLGVDVIDDPEVGYYQSKKMTALAHKAREKGAEWVIPFDADEVWLGEGSLRNILSGLPEHAQIAEATLLDHVPTPRDPDGTPVASIQWRREEIVPLRKVAVRTHRRMQIHQGNHGADFGSKRPPLTVTGELEIRHFPYRSPEQFIRKVRNGAAAYAASDLPPTAGQHWRDYGRTLERGGEQALVDHFHKWFYSDDPEADGLIHDPCP